MSSQRRRRRPLPLLLASVSLAAGCSEVQSRQWGYPNGLSRLIDARKGLSRASKARAPLVKLRVEDDAATAAKVPAVEGPAAQIEGARRKAE